MLQLTSLRLTRWVGVSVAACALAACEPPAPTSVNAIEADASQADEVLGAWYGELNGYEAYVHVVEGDGGDGELETVVVQEGSGWGSGKAIPASINNDGYLSLELLEEQGADVNDPLVRGYHLVRYRKSRGYVTLYAMDSDAVEAAIRSGEIAGDLRPETRLTAEPHELAEFIAKHGDDLFTVQVGYLEAVEASEMPPVREGGNR